MNTGDASKIAINSGVLATAGSIGTTKLAVGTSTLGLGRAAVASVLHQSLAPRAFSSAAGHAVSKDNLDFDNMLIQWTDNASDRFNKLKVCDQNHSFGRTELGAIEVICANILNETTDAILTMANPDLSNEKGYT